MSSDDKTCLFEVLEGLERVENVDDWEEGGVGGIEALEEDDAGQHHVNEDNPGSEGRRRIFLALLGDSSEENEEVPAVVQMFRFGLPGVEIKQNKICDGENCRPQENVSQASQPGVRAEFLQKGQNTSQVPPRELYEEFIPEGFIVIS